MSLEDLDGILPHVVDQGLPDGGEFLAADLADDERTPRLIALLIWHGYLPMAGMGMLLPKIHNTRCIMLLPGDLHVGRKVRRQAKGYHLTVDTAWEDVVGFIQRLTCTSTPSDCWLSDELARAYSAVGQCAHRGGVTFHSVELWHTESGELAAGEIGYTCGSVYSSATGFSKKERFPGAGTVQMAALGRWLAACGFTIWDLGMPLDYKHDLGGNLVPRSEWARRIRQLRDTEARLSSPTGDLADARHLICGAPT